MPHIYICFAFTEHNGIAFEYSKTLESENIQKLVDSKLASNPISIKIETDLNEFDDRFASLAIAKHLWREFGNVLVDENGSDGNIEEPFLHFENGTPVYEIWSWFEGEFDISVAIDLMNLK